MAQNSTRNFPQGSSAVLSSNRPEKRGQLEAMNTKSRIAILARRLLVTFDSRVFCQSIATAVNASAV
jgi:hypothetical protein